MEPDYAEGIPSELVTRHPGQSRQECPTGVCTEQGKSSLPGQPKRGETGCTWMVRNDGGGLIHSSVDHVRDRKVEEAKGLACSVSH